MWSHDALPPAEEETPQLSSNAKDMEDYPWWGESYSKLFANIKTCKEIPEIPEKIKEMRNVANQELQRFKDSKRRNTTNGRWRRLDGLVTSFMLLEHGAAGFLMEAGLDSKSWSNMDAVVFSTSVFSPKYDDS